MNNTEKLMIEGTVLKSRHKNIIGEVVIPDGVTEISCDAFFGCTAFTTIKIPNSVTKSGAGVFSGCTGLTSIEIPDSVTKIGPSAFSGCTGQQVVRVGLNFSKTDRNIERYVVE